MPNGAFGARYADGQPAFTQVLQALSEACTQRRSEIAEVGTVDEVIAASDLRPKVIDVIERAWGKV